MIRIDRDRDVLGIIDVQPTFMPGGELPVPDGEAVVAPINALMDRHFSHAFATQDWHPPGHISFASTHGRPPFSTVTLPYGEQTLWPDHGIIDTPGSLLHPGLKLARIDAVFRKGHRSHIDSYSAFRENDRTTGTGLGGWMRELGFTRLFLCGLAFDYCVSWSAQDARALGYEVYVIEDACRGIGAPRPGGPTAYGDTTMDEARHAMRLRGIHLILSADLG